jgi:hypothetical protein
MLSLYVEQFRHKHVYDNKSDYLKHLSYRPIKHGRLVDSEETAVNISYQFYAPE